MMSIAMAVALLTPGQCCDSIQEEVNKLIRDRVLYGGYGTYGGCYPRCCPTYAAPTYAVRPPMPCPVASYGPAIQYAPVHYGPAQFGPAAAPADGHCQDHKEIHRRLDDFKCALDRLTDGLLSLEKRVCKHEKATQDGFKAVDCKFKEVDDHLKALEKKQKKIVKKLDERIKPLEEKSKTTEEGLKALAKKIEDDAREAEIKGLNEKLKKLEENEKLKQFEDKFSAADRLKALENKLLQTEGTDRKRDEALIQFIDQKLDRLQSGLKRDVEGIQDQLKRVDSQLRDEKDGRLRLEDRLKRIEQTPPPPPPPPAPKEPLREPREVKPEVKEGAVRALPEIKLANLNRAAAVPANKAVIVVKLPADARLYLNGQLTQATGATRTFVTPAIETGTSFTYTVRVEWVKNAELVAQTRQVVFQAGQQVNVRFDASLQTAQAK